MRGQAVAASGNVKFGEKLAVGFDVRRASGRIEVQNLTVRDAASDAAFSGSFSEFQAQARFKGRLAASTLQRVFLEPNFDAAEVQGDLQAQGDLAAPLEASVVGSLRGSGMPIPTDLPIPTRHAGALFHPR